MAWGHNHPPPPPTTVFQIQSILLCLFYLSFAVTFCSLEFNLSQFQGCCWLRWPKWFMCVRILLEGTFFQCSQFGMVFWLHQKIYLKLVLSFVGWSRKCSPETNHRLTSSCERSRKYSDLLKLSVLNLWPLRVTSM